MAVTQLFVNNMGQQQPPPTAHMNGYPQNMMPHYPMMLQPPQQQNPLGTVAIIIVTAAVSVAAVCMYNMHTTQQHLQAFQQFSDGPPRPVPNGGPQTHCWETVDTDESSEDVGWFFSSLKMHKKSTRRAQCVTYHNPGTNHAPGIGFHNPLQIEQDKERP